MEQVKDYADEITRDAIGNLIVLKRGNGEEKKKIMVAAHMDEIGLCVVKITEEGFLKVKKVGGVSAHCSFMNRVIFRNGTVGTVAAYAKPEEFKSGEIEKLYIDMELDRKRKPRNMYMWETAQCSKEHIRSLQEEMSWQKHLTTEVLVTFKSRH